ncbi:MAG TPA: hypothetical protein VN803_06825 [Gemmatimonadales bacterium]|nr:hypothetical protein [Gemmatimonadales bacterium]
MEITTSDLLQMQDAITSTVRHEVGQARQEFRAQLSDVRVRTDRHERDIARLQARTRGAARRVVNSLSPKQKAALWSVAITAGGAALDGLRHIVVAIIGLYAKGVRLP